MQEPLSREGIPNQRQVVSRACLGREQSMAAVHPSTLQPAGAPQNPLRQPLTPRGELETPSTVRYPAPDRINPCFHLYV